MLRTLSLSLLLFLSASSCLPACAQVLSQSSSAATVLQPAQLQSLIPATVYFSGQIAPVQIRNSAAVRSAAGKLTIFAMVDAGGYSSGVRERYQFYVLTDTAIEVNGKRLPAGAYGGGFINPAGFEVMDLGGNELFHTPTIHDAALKRPHPLEILEDSHAGEYRLYIGRDYVVFRQMHK